MSFYRFMSDLVKIDEKNREVLIGNLFVLLRNQKMITEMIFANIGKDTLTICTKAES